MFRLFLIVLTAAFFALTDAIIHRIPLYKVDSIQQTMKRNQLKQIFGNTIVGLLIDRLDVQYYGIISIGSPPQNFTVMFDTTSTHFWIPTVHCLDNNLACQHHNKYDNSKSRTYQPMDSTPITIDYSDGNVTGYFSTDVVNIGSLEVKNQTFAEVLIEGILLALRRFDGILGLGYAIEDNVTSVFYNMVKQKLCEPVFSFYLNTDPSSNIAGELMLGGIDPAHYSDELTYFPVTQKGYWQFAMNKITIRNYTLCMGGCQVIVDTISAHILGPSNEIDVINRVIGADEYGKVDCNSVHEMPIFWFHTNYTKMVLLPYQYIIKKKYDDSSVLCWSGFKGLNSVLWFLGDVFLRSFYSVYDMKYDRVGFAPSKSSDK